MRPRSQMISERKREGKRLTSAAKRACNAGEDAAMSEAERRLFGVLEDVLASSDEDARSFFTVAGIDLKQVSPDRFWTAFRAHYALPGGAMDEARVAADLSVWPPIALRVAEIRAGRG